MPSVYQLLFGGSLVAPAIPTYLSLPMSANQVLGWPLESNITSPAAAEIIDVSATVGGLTIQLSDARSVGTGYCALFNNVGANTFTLLDAQGNTLMAPAPGAAWQIYLADNSTLQGTWRVFQYGASVSTANAATLAGAGLKAISTTLNEQITFSPQAASYTIGSGTNQDRAACIEWTGGAGGTFSSSTAATLGAGWFCYIKNSGTGVVSFVPGSGQINGSASMTFNPNDSAIIATDGTNFFSIGFGQSVASSFNFVTISLAGDSGNVILTGAQLNRISYRFTGALAGNTVVIVPASIQQYWVDNETTGAFTLTISAGGAGSTFVVPQASRVILYCDGLNIVSAITGGGVTFGNGTAAAPSITFSSDGTTGLYLPGAGVLGFAAGGRAVGSVNASGQWSFPAPTTGTALTINAAASSLAANISGTVEFTNLGLPNISLNSSGANLGLLSNTAANTWSLGYGTSAVAAGTSVLSWNNTGAVTIAVPVSGVALSVTGINGQSAVSIAASSGAAQALILGWNVGLVSNVWNVFTQSTDGLAIGTAGASSLSLVTNASPRLAITSAGNVSIAVPTSGTALTVDIPDSSIGVLLQGSTPTNGFQMRFADSSSVRGLIGYGPDVVVGGALTDFGVVGNNALFFSANGGSSKQVTLTSTGNVTVNAPSSGVAFTANAVASSYGIQVVAPNSAGVSRGLQIVAGTNASDVGLVVANAAATTNYFEVRGDGVVFGNDGTNLFELGYKDVPLNAQGTNYTAVVSDRGKAINATATINVTIPSGVFSAGAVVTVTVGSGAIATIVQGSGLTLQWVGNGATTGSRTLTGAGMATILFLTSTAALISGGGLT